MKAPIQRQYDEIAHLYDILSDGDDGFIQFRKQLERDLTKLAWDAKTLDCSCGTGGQAIWLARQGFSVYASDISEGMLAMAAAKAEKANVDINFFQSAWKDLHKNAKEKFSLVMSPGNSFSHLEGIDMLYESLYSIKKIMSPGGMFTFDIRNWEMTFKDESLHSQKFQLSSDDTVYHVRYVWDIKGWNALSKMEVDIRTNKETEYKRYFFDFFPIGYAQLNEALMSAGFKSIKRVFYPDGDYYAVTAM